MWVKNLISFIKAKKPAIIINSGKDLLKNEQNYKQLLTGYQKIINIKVCISSGSLEYSLTPH